MPGLGGMEKLRALWPDADRRDAALMRVLLAAVRHPEPRSSVTASELRVLQLASLGMEWRESAEILGSAPETVKAQLKRARRALRAKNTTHAVAEALRQGLIP